MMATATERSTRSGVLVTCCCPKPSPPFSSLHNSSTHHRRTDTPTTSRAVTVSGRLVTLGTMPSQGLQVSPFAVEEVQYQEPAEDQLVPMAETRPQDPQALRQAAGQTGQGQVQASWVRRDPMGNRDQLSLGEPGR